MTISKDKYYKDMAKALLMGHKSIKMTLRYSPNLSFDHKKRAVDALNSHIGTLWAQSQRSYYPGVMNAIQHLSLN